MILQLAAYVANTSEEARSVPEASTMRARRLVRESLSQAADQEAYERLKRISEVTYDDVLTRVAYGTAEEVVDRRVLISRNMGGGDELRLGADLQSRGDLGNGDGVAAGLAVRGPARLAPIFYGAPRRTIR